MTIGGGNSKRSSLTVGCGYQRRVFVQQLQHPIVEMIFNRVEDVGWVRIDQKLGDRFPLSMLGPTQARGEVAFLTQIGIGPLLDEVADHFSWP